MRGVSDCLILLLTALAAPVTVACPASLILMNGRIWTENPRQPEAQAIAIEGDHIVSVGSAAQIGKLATPDCKVIDLAGRRVVPGFNDAHVHFIAGGDALTSVQLGDVDSRAQFRERIGEYARSLPRGSWIRNGNWDHQRWPGAPLPTHELIDAVTTDNPVLVWRLDGHMALANALAMKLAGLDRHTPDVPGGEIMRDSQGNPTGILKDEATGLVERVMPPLSDRELDAAMQAAVHEAVIHGVTSVQNLWDSPTDTYSTLKFREFEKFARTGRLQVRIYHANPLRDWKSLATAGLQAPFGNPLLRIGNLKSFADGALGSETAWMDAPFADRPGYSGLASSDLRDSDAMYASLVGADAAGLQISMHAIGDRAIHTVLDLFERVAQQNGPADRRFRIEHVQHLRPADATRFAPLGVIASMQPYHAIDDGRWAEKELGPERIQSSYAWRLLLEHGAVLAFGSDWPIAPLDPLLGIYAAVTRRTLDGNNPGGWVPQQRITVAEAVHAYTMGSAFAEHQETIKGSLEPGKLADLAVLSDDIFTAAPNDLDKVHIEMTVFNGAVVYQRTGTSPRLAALSRRTGISSRPAALTANADAPASRRHPIAELTPLARIHLGKTADWIAITDDAVWVGITGPDGVARIDPATNRVTKVVSLPGNPCAGLALGFDALWVPLCAKPNALARVDLQNSAVTLVPGVGPAAREGGITTSGDSVWLVTESATLARIDPHTLHVQQRISVPPASLNPLYDGNFVWVTRAAAAQITVVDAQNGSIVATLPTGPRPHFLAAGGGSVWTLNQGDGTLTRIDAASRRILGSIALHTPGEGGDITFGAGTVWTSMLRVPLSAIDAQTGRLLCQWTGAGGDALGTRGNALWLTDYKAGDIYRFDVQDILRRCRGSP